MCVTLGIPISRLMTTLIDMEFKGIIITYPVVNTDFRKTSQPVCALESI